MVLDRIVEEKRRAPRPRLDELPPGPPPRDFAGALRRAGKIRAIAEFKRASPSAGPIRPGADPADVAARYEAAGAAAISVLTDEKFFDGAMGHVAIARARVEIPILRKDFLIDELGVHEARSAGADAVLLIVRLLDDRTLRAMNEAANRLGMAALVETHTADEVKRAVDAGATIIGVNHRDLDTLVIDMSLFARVRALLPAGTIAVAESGIKTPADVRRLEEAGADAILVGEALMKKEDPGAALAELLA